MRENFKDLFIYIYFHNRFFKNPSQLSKYHIQNNYEIFLNNLTYIFNRKIIDDTNKL